MPRARSSVPARAVLRRASLALVIVGAALASGACSDGASGPQDASVERGRQVYQASCTACHNQNPALPGALGPDVKGASRDLIEARIVRGQYPPGYTPKRPTSIMPPQPGLAPDVQALADYLKN